MAPPRIPIAASAPESPGAAPVAPVAPVALPGWPLLRLGFRPFYLGAALFALLAAPLWVAVVLGAWPAPMAVPPLLWHAHEMLFGFATAVIVGFLFTAAKAWTGLQTPRGATLGALALLWLAARVAALAGPGALFALLDLALLPAAAFVLLRVLLRANNRRNLPLVGVLVLLALANAVFHAALAGWISVSPLAALHAALALVVVIECVMAGRVVPSFTVNATPGLKLKPAGRIEALLMPATVLGLAAWVFVPPSLPGALLLLAATLLHTLRLLRWQPWVTRTRPILWVLHAAYAWLPLGLALLALAQLGLLPESAGVHALGVGATGGLIIGMVTRTARGHTGRPLVASPLETAAYAGVMAAALLRTLLPLLLPPPLALTLAALAWSAAFAAYLWRYTPWLLRTRLDGKDG